MSGACLAAELLQAKEAAVRDALHDPLTGLPNRAFFIGRLNAALARTNQGASDFAVFFLDLDGFKRVNDSLGHVVGDSLLVQVADRPRGLVRLRERTNGHASGEPMSDVLARFGGDEFTVLLADVRGEDDAMKVAARIQNALDTPFVVQGQDVYVTVSIGIVLSCAGYTAPADILRDADLAMYRAKSRGETRAEIYDASMHAQATARLRLENDLRRAVHNEEFVLHYQPIVSLRTDEIVGFEALVRWQPPGRDLVYPDDFIPLAEETGIIVPLGIWVLREACRQAREWRRPGGANQLTMRINLSPRQFADRDVVRVVRAVLRETMVDPAVINLEVTESSAMGDPERAVQVLSQLKSLGVKLSIDDFGTGYSSLAYLHRFPLDSLKIDQSFLASLLNKPESRQIIRTILALAKGLKMDVVAEGIENREQADEMKRLGCGLGQGYLFSKPLSPSDVSALLSQCDASSPIVAA